MRRRLLIVGHVSPEAGVGARPRMSRIACVAFAVTALLAATGCGTLDGYQSTGSSAQNRHPPPERHSRAADNAEPVQRTPGIGRSCAQSDGFDRYWLGQSFEGLPLTGRDRICTPPPEQLRDESGVLVYETPTRGNMYFYVYGNCDPPRDARTGRTLEGGCTPPMSITSSPACEQPHSLYTRFASRGYPLPHKHVLVRQAPAAIFTDGPRQTRIEIYTGDARVLVTGIDAQAVRRAAEQIAATPGSRRGAETADTPLPKPVAGAADDDAVSNPSCH